MITGLELNTDGRVRLKAGDEIVQMVDVEAVEWRSTEKGLRPSSRVSVDSDNAHFDPEAIVLTGDYVFGVDTNTVNLGNRTVHVTALTCATRQIKNDGFEGSIQQIQCIDFEDHEETPEKIGWLIAVTAITRSRPNPGSNVFLCTDHDANLLPKINKREIPLCNDVFLPDGLTMVYARDKGSTVQNKVVASAHKAATSVIRNIKANPPRPQLVKPFLDGYMAGGIRRWKNSDNSDLFFSD